MKLKPGMFTQNVMEFINVRERQGKNGDVDRSLAAVTFALAAGIDLITFPFTWTGAIVDGLISRYKVKVR